ncbi:nicotinamide-nucleotide amidase [Yersinia nurmii]|uniref:Competence damage-inducible protein A n=1 Tax=Yersinia nurmii TaxID=685706 RepID=A0AAW7K7Q5_9GAMM|nr:nicotinamide-nucleotide amidase [Yersinia nurmii]MDN0088902.1 nicotinamide-nucleotide amidase [Yersinia nurmii]CNF06681.1 competence damage-inducible protein A [Yersinia nurmii]
MNEQQLRQLSIDAGELLKARGASVTCAESCTGGWIAKALTDIAGSSAYFDRGFVTYSNEAKHDLLGVAETTLDAYGAVSEEVVREMAVGALHAAQADFALSVSGIAGPDGGTEFKPVGTVWFGFATKAGQVSAEKRAFNGNRDEIRLQATIFALQTLVDKFLKK